MYNYVDYPFKQLTESISFVDDPDPSICGVNFYNDGCHVEIYNAALRRDVLGDSAIRTVFHEMGHSFFRMMRLNGTTEWENIVKEEGFTSAYGKGHYDDDPEGYNRFAEDIADTWSVMQFVDIPFKQEATLLDPDETLLTYDEFYERFPKKIKYIEQEIEKWYELNK